METRLAMACILAAALARPLNAAEYRITDLGMIGRTASHASINDAGQFVAGFYAEASEDSPFLLFDDGMSITDLSTVFPQGALLNEQGQVFGTAPNGAGSSILRGFDNGAVHDLRMFSSDSVRIADMNRNGYYVGTMSFGEELHTFIGMLSDEAITDVGSLGGNVSAATSINDSGQVVGFSWNGPLSMAPNDGEIFPEAFLYEEGIIIPLGTLGGFHSLARAISDSGIVVGEASISPTGPVHAFVYDTVNGMRGIGMPGLDSVAEDINESGLIVGNAEITSNVWRAAIFSENRGVQFLDDLISPNSAWDFLFRATDINNLGQIAGLGSIGGELHAFLLTPIPEPSSLALMLTALFFFAERLFSGRSFHRYGPNN